MHPKTKETPLIKACVYGITNLALKLIETGKSKPEHVNNCGETALFVACEFALEAVALKLIETGKSKPEQVNNDGYTALMYACKNNLETVALKLIETGKSKPEQVTNFRPLYPIGRTALDFSIYRKLKKVIIRLKPVTNISPFMKKTIENPYQD